jgi:putative tryptophan/tyrosine transport system substrate-binding protein
MRRRDFLAVIGGAAGAWPLAASAQSRLPIIGYLRNTATEESIHLLEAFRKGLKDSGFVEGRNVQIEYRYSGGQTDQLSALAADLVARSASVIVALGNTPAVRAAKAATSTTPIVFMVGADPVQLGLVQSLARPGGNLTGLFNLNQQLAQKWLEIMKELVPEARRFALLVNPTNQTATARYIQEMHAAARNLNVEMHVSRASAHYEFDGVFSELNEHRVQGLVIAADSLFIGRVDRLAALCLRQKLAAIYPFREFPLAGGLASYGTDLAETYRLAGVYTARVLSGEKPAEMPVQQASKIELVLNLKTARALEITPPPSLVARADEVIE